MNPKITFSGKVPITKRWKVIFAMESAILLAMFIFSFTLFGILHGIFGTTIHFYLIRYYVQIELVIFSFWTILLTTRFPQNRIITWPFVKKEAGK
jgi:cytochrome c biogenesis protein CcdA